MLSLSVTHPFPPQKNPDFSCVPISTDSGEASGEGMGKLQKVGCASGRVHWALESGPAGWGRSHVALQKNPQNGVSTQASSGVLLPVYLRQCVYVII